MQTDNKKLYESDEVVAKYSANTARARSLNDAEKIFIDRFDIKNKNILVIGGGGGRVPVNLLIYGNKVKSIDSSKRLTDAAKRNFPSSKFADLIFEYGDAVNLSGISDKSYDVVFFPMNSLDCINPFKDRERALTEAAKKVKKGGILAFSSHNKLAYAFSYKVPLRNKRPSYLNDAYVFDQENVVGGGYIFKGNPRFVINHVCKLTGFSFAGFVCDARNKFDKLIARNLWTAQLIFPYILYVFTRNLEK
jgi:ubiquinone/menaquinone biosynthesis C-methylase UbiE